ncbi:helix-turn-helix domain-containing protein [Bradyrhizobium sp. PMVTL-01]|uniref:helix-turn-helix domain-containing protein n=1 Tax=Bradyrhizobium sp. PMVTL-01 TaxID=3434999 RepID=UPI003F71FB3B
MRARALVAYNLRRIRVQRGIPQEQLAYDAGIDRSYMSGLERQQANPTIDLPDRLAETLTEPRPVMRVKLPRGGFVQKLALAAAHWNGVT